MESASRLRCRCEIFGTGGNLRSSEHRVSLYNFEFDTGLLNKKKNVKSFQLVYILIYSILVESAHV
jgi:hypothetical protein